MMTDPRDDAPSPLAALSASFRDEDEKEERLVAATRFAPPPSGVGGGRRTSTGRNGVMSHHLCSLSVMFLARRKRRAT